MQKHVVQKLEGVVDEEKKISHEKLAEETEDAFGEPAKLGVKLSADLLEPCYTPIIQSGVRTCIRLATSRATDLIPCAAPSVQSPLPAFDGCT